MTTMARVQSTHLKGAYTTTLTGAKQPCVSLESAVVHYKSPQTATPLQSDQPSSTLADILLSDLTGMTADLQDIGYYKVALNLLPHDHVFTHNIGLHKSAP